MAKVRNKDRCEFPACRNKSAMTWYERRLCDSCFQKWKAEDLKVLLDVVEDAKAPAPAEAGIGGEVTV